MQTGRPPFKLSTGGTRRVLLPAQQGYDRAITVFSPDGRLYQVEYAIETVRRGSIAVGVLCSEGVAMAVEEKSRKLQVADHAQKIFEIDDHVGVAAAGYIPDARSQVDNARFFSQSNRLIYDEPVDVETVARHIADQSQQFTQYAGVRPNGVALIMAGVSRGAPSLYLTDPSGTYVSYEAVAIGDGSDRVTPFLEKEYKKDMSLDEASALAAASILLAGDQGPADNIRMAQVSSSTGKFGLLDAAGVSGYADAARSKFNQG